MKITKYEIDVLDVGAADAILIHFFDENDSEYLILIDAGRYADGKKVEEFIWKYYPNCDVDLAFCTHCDDDHYGGFIYLAEQMQKYSCTSIKIDKMVINDPGLHVKVDETMWYRSQENVKKEARSVYSLENGKNLLEELTKAGVSYADGFSDKNYYYLERHIEIVGPTVRYYESLVYDLRHGLKAVEESEDVADSQIYDTKVFSKTLEDAGDDGSANNQSSIMLLFKPDDGKKYLLMGDAGRDAFDNMQSIDKNNIENVDWLKVPHHGSKHNLDNDMINHIHPSVAFVSAEKYGKYLSKAVVSALNKVGCNVYGTLGTGSLCHRKGIKTKDGYVIAEEL